MKRTPVSSSAFVLIALAIGGLGSVLLGLLFGDVNIFYWISLFIMLAFLPRIMHRFFATNRCDGWTTCLDRARGVRTQE